MHNLRTTPKSKSFHPPFPKGGGGLERVALSDTHPFKNFQTRVLFFLPLSMRSTVKCTIFAPNPNAKNLSNFYQHFLVLIINICCFLLYNISKLEHIEVKICHCTDASVICVKTMTKHKSRSQKFLTCSSPFISVMNAANESYPCGQQ